MRPCDAQAQEIFAPIVDPNSGFTFTKKSPSARPNFPKPVYAGTSADVGICTMDGIYGASWLIGSIGPDGVCWANMNGRSFHNTGSQYYISELDGTEWVAGGKGTVPVYAIPAGVHQDTKGTLTTVYICRTKFVGNFTGNVETSRFGWTTDGATCHYTYYNHKPTTSFEVLARDPKKSYSLTLNQYWPKPKSGIWYPGLPHTLAKDLKHKEVQKVVKVAAKAVAHAAEHAVRKVLHFHHHHHHHHHHWW